MEVEIIKKKDNLYQVPNSNQKDRLRVAAYARVSTDSEEQQTSFTSQQKYYMDKIYNNPNWIFVDVYADEGITGTQVSKRENFLRMIKDAEEGKIDLILTKSISRFARNTVDVLKYVRRLKAIDVAIQFEEEHINTLDMTGELLLTVLSSVAQQESETISSHVKLGLKMKRERGELVGYNNCYGYYYDKTQNKLSIVSEEAKVVKQIYDWYLQGYGCTSIVKLLRTMKIKRPNGNDDKWCENTICNILSNEKYVGDIIQGKTYVVDPLTHKQVINNGEEDRYLMRNFHEPIISREDFDKVQDIKNSRNRSRLTGRSMCKKYTFSGRFRCGFCGKSYVKKSLYKKREAWDCLTVQSDSRVSCKNSRLMHQDVLESCFMEAYYLLSNNDALVIDTFVKELSKGAKKDKYKPLKEKALEEKASLKSRYDKLLDLYMDGQLEREQYELKIDQLQTQIDKISNKIEQYDQQIGESKKIETGLERVKKELLNREATTDVKEFDPNLFEAIVDYGIIGGYDEYNEAQPYLIRFICKNGFDLRSRDDISPQNIINNGITRKDGIYEPILDFISNQHFFVYENFHGRRQRILVTKVRVRVEIEKPTS